LSHPLAGHLKNLGNFRWLREFRLDGRQEYKVGDNIDTSIFEEGGKVNVSGVTKGRGFQGVVKRHGFGGAPATHGTKHAHREPGSIGATHPQHVVKGRKMAGHMGGERVTTKNLRVATIDVEKNVIALVGSVPGAVGSLVEVRG
ncbi:MAG: 50S ribosomal protein L3, partial [Parcubacteria group bacterium]|nr:50S ribosomal protein L3 [Parcubacteria group bacterium]